MNIKILIVEDDDANAESSEYVCKEIAKEMGFVVTGDSIIRTSTIKNTMRVLERDPFSYDVVLLDIGLEDGDIGAKNITEIIKKDYLLESKVIINTGDEGFYEDHEKIMDAINNGAKGIAIKGEPWDPEDPESGSKKSLEYQLIKVLKEIRYEVVWSNIGRLTPTWKRAKFKNKRLWEDLKDGRKSKKAFLLLDISNSTQFVQQQRLAGRADNDILDLFKIFANITTNILEKKEYKGIVERYSGDEILAYFDITASKKGDAYFKEIINCVVDIKNSFQKEVEKIYHEHDFVPILYNGHKIQPNLRILIDHGEVLWVLLGSESRPQLSVMTDKIAKFYRCFTHRDENGNRTLLPNEIFITHEYYKYIKSCEDFKCEFYDSITLKDFGDEKIYKIMEEK